MKDCSDVKEMQRTVWESGDYSVIGSTLQIVAECLCEAIDLRGGQQVLDVGTGSGNAALAAARRSCDVTAVDFAPTLLERGRLRAAAEGVAVNFLEGDAEGLPFADAAFDAVISTFGVMFAPDHEKAAHELLRVCRPGGKLGLANWTPEGVFGASGRVISEFLPPAPGIASPALWGTVEHLRDIFGRHVRFDHRVRTVIYRYRSVDHYMDTLRSTYPPLMNTFSKLADAAQDSLAAKLRDLYQSKNEADDGTFLMPMHYLEVIGRKLA